MSGSTPKPIPTLVDYKSAEERLLRVRDEAAAGVKAAHERGDVDTGNEWISKLQKEFDAFKAFREGLPREVRLSIHADRILESFSVDKDNFVNLVIPADVSDEDAMHALNGRFRDMFPERARAAIYELDIEKILESGDGSGSRSHSPRILRVIGVVPGTTDMTRDQQAEVLQQKGLTFAHPIDQALAAAAYECQCDGDRLINLVVRGSVSRFALSARQGGGIRVDSYEDDGVNAYVAASGSSSPEVK